MNKGKQFEAKFKSDWIASMPESSIDRLYDTTMGYAAISNISDFIGYKYPNIYYLETKSHEGASFPLSNLTQYEKLKAKVGIPGVRTGMVLWLIDKDLVMYVPISTITKLLDAGIKSFNPDKIEKLGYTFYKIPSVKKRVFMDSDYSILTKLQDGE